MQQRTSHKRLFGEGPLTLVLVFALLATGIGAAGYFFYAGQRSQIIKAAQNNLTAIADLKVSQIDSWRHERFLDGKVILSRPLLFQIHRFIEEGGSPHREEILEWLQGLKQQPSYENAAIVDREGHVLLSTDPGFSLAHFGKKIISEALAKGTVTLTDFHSSPEHRHIHLDLIVPLFSPRSSGAAPFGALLIAVAARRPFSWLRTIRRSGN